MPKRLRFFLTFRTILLIENLKLANFLLFGNAEQPEFVVLIISRLQARR